MQLTSSPAARPGDTLLSPHLAGGGVNYTMDSGTLTVPAILKSGGGAASTISGGDSLTTAGNAEPVIRTDTSSDSLTISTGITGTSGGLTKTGKGTLTLSGTNGYTGVTRVLDGTLVLEGGSAIVDGQQILLASAPDATLQLNSSETVLNLYGGGFSGGTVDVQGNTLTLSGGSTVTFGGTYTGTASGGIVKQGANQLTLTNKNTFAGTFTIEGGAVEFQYGNDGTGTLIPLSSGGDFNMANGTTLRFNPQLNLPWGTVRSAAPSGQWRLAGLSLRLDFCQRHQHHRRHREHHGVTVMKTPFGLREMSRAIPAAVKHLQSIRAVSPWAAATARRTPSQEPFKMAAAARSV